MRINAILFLCMILCGCSSNREANDPLPREEMKKVIFDLLRADEIVNNSAVKDTSLNRDSLATQLYEQVFSIHKIDRKRFYKSYRYYQAHPDENKVLFDSLNSWGNRKRSVAVE